ncbi:unnamed protein product [Bursaphelenchus xylophilus]|uniref:Protein YIPF n=1 Tax=Bursaphelenchus xylophilus TaxID=6326 RepID=A0A1I7SWY3_BURXY|nr:unnamed protein product [Bursaphelenchus xylophilus]CAG9100048.1 unnamed protein product [Bursaphelenchus xylophilus]
MANLQFQDFTVGGHDSPFTSINSSNDQRDSTNTKDDINLIGSDSQTSVSNAGSNFLSLQFYKQYFDVDTDTVQSRILSSFIPKMNGNFIRDNIQPSADLYGPFWISVTLVFFAAICGNFAHYIDSLGDTYTANDFRLVTGVATLIFLYVTFVPLLVYTVLWYRKSAIQYGYIELLCAFGYSLSIFVPVSVLWIVHYQAFRWTLIVVSVALSGTVLANTVWGAIKTDSNKLVAFGLVAGVILLHSLLAIGIKELYFDTVIPNGGAVSIAPPPPTPAALIIDNKTELPATLKPQALVAKNDEIKLPEDLKNSSVKTGKRETVATTLLATEPAEPTTVSPVKKEEKKLEKEKKNEVKQDKNGTQKKEEAPKTKSEDNEVKTQLITTVIPPKSADNSTKL